jgi:hypothetical protein
MGSEKRPVPLRVRQHEDDPLDPAVAALEPDPPLERLEVGWSGLGFDAHGPAPKTGRRVPGALITRDRKRHLSSPRRIRRQHRPEPLKQSAMDSIAQRLPARERPSAQVEADDREAHRQEAQAGFRGQAALDATDPGRRDASGARDIGLT